MLPTYARLVERMCDSVRGALDEAGLRLADVSGRAKDVDSFVKKAIRKGYNDPVAETGDKAGVRIVVPFAAERAAAENAAESVLALFDRDDKRAGLEIGEVGYLGLHFRAQLRPERLGAADADLAGVEAELQIHTKAENAYAAATHDKLYKASLPVPPEIGRRLANLGALAEIFDDQVSAFDAELASLPGYEALDKLQAPLDRLLVRFSRRVPDAGLSAQIIPPVATLYDEPLGELFGSRIAPWVEHHEAPLMEFFARYEDDDRANPLIFQPEAFMLFERLENDRYRLREAWPQTLDARLLSDLAIVRGVPLR